MSLAVPMRPLPPRKAKLCRSSNPAHADPRVLAHRTLHMRTLGYQPWPDAMPCRVHEGAALARLRVAAATPSLSMLYASCHGLPSVMNDSYYDETGETRGMLVRSSHACERMGKKTYKIPSVPADSGWSDRVIVRRIINDRCMHVRQTILDEGGNPSNGRCDPPRPSSARQGGAAWNSKPPQ